MLGQNQLHVDFPGFADLGAVRMDHHALHRAGIAGSDQLGIALHLDHTDTAGADLIQVFQITEGRNVDTCL